MNNERFAYPTFSADNDIENFAKVSIVDPAITGLTFPLFAMTKSSVLDNLGPRIRVPSVFSNVLHPHDITSVYIWPTYVKSAEEEYGQSEMYNALLAFLIKESQSNLTTLLNFWYERINAYQMLTRIIKN